MIVWTSPAWAPQAMLAEVTRARSAVSLLHPSPRSAFKSMARSLISKSLPEPGLEFGRADRLEAEAVPRADGEVSLFEVHDPQWRPTEQVPATGRGFGV